MAYAALVSLAQTIEKILNHDQYPISLHEKQQIISIQDHITFLQAFLEDFPDKARSWEGRIRDSANEAEDIIEYYMSEQIRRYYTAKSTAAGTESVDFSQQQGGMFMFLRRRSKAGIHRKDKLHFDFKELRKVKVEIDSIAGEVVQIKNSTRTAEDVHPSDFSAEAASSSSSRQLGPTRKDAIVGFDDDLLEIKTRLCGESSNLQIIPIFGMGGIGKTTLARNAYDDPLTVEFFHIRAWVTVSQEYSAQEILSSLRVSIEAIDGEREQRNESSEERGYTRLKGKRYLIVNESMELVYKSLKGKRYLIVMDDMWSTKAWDEVRRIFPDDHNGSRIMLTTRLTDVATYPNSSSRVHEMRFMDMDQSWNLLKKKVFTREECPSELESIGKTIARSCRGLPLAIVVIAGLLSKVSRTRAAWESIASNVYQVVTKNNEQFAKIVLSLSYNHLPQHLRQCFLYMGGIPKDYELYVSRLVKLWIAEGFLKPIGSKASEDVAEEYLEDLVKRSLVLVVKRKTNGKIKSCSVHDLVRDLCIRKAQEEKFLLHVLDSCVHKVLQESNNDQRRICIDQSDQNSLANIYGSTIRTIICFQHNGNSLGSLGNFRLLRVLDVVSANFTVYRIVVLPAEVFELFHLRYLAFDYPMKLPAAILNLQNLQTLIVHPRKKLRSYLPSLVYLPLEIWRMPQLRHLVSFFFSPLPHPERATFGLENLQTLSVATNFICSKRILKMIPNLKKLGISYFGDEYVEDYHLDNLVHLDQLKTLKLKIYEGFPFREKLHPIFPTSLRKLALSGWKIPWKDIRIFGSLPNLEVLKLRDYACDGDRWETTEGDFQNLKFLLIDESNLQQWITESWHFPNLKRLVLYRCRCLSEIPDSIGEIPTLELIEVDDQNEALVDSAKSIQEEQLETWGNDVLQVRSVHYDIWMRDIK